MSTTYCSDVHTFTSISLYTYIHICLYIFLRKHCESNVQIKLKPKRRRKVNLISKRFYNVFEDGSSSLPRKPGLYFHITCYPPVATVVVMLILQICHTFEDQV